MLGLEDKRVLVTASTKGIGFAIAKKFLEFGSKVFITSRNEENVNKALRELSKYGEVYGTTSDIAKREDRERLVREMLNTLGDIDVFVFNTGGPPTKAFEETTLEDWENAYKLLLEAAVHLTKLILPKMLEKRYGRLIYVTSIATKMPVEGLVLSNGIRIGIEGLMKTLVKEYASKGVTFNSVLPGYTLTERVKEVLMKKAEMEGKEYKEVLEELAQKIPLGRLANPEEIANAVIFLASDLGSYVNGVALQVDGGLIPTVF